MRARQWCPELGAFLSIDEYRYHSPRTTLWGWPEQNPLRYRDPSGRDGTDDLIEFERLGGLDYLAGYGAGLLDTVPLYAGMPGSPTLGDVADWLDLSGKHPKRSNANAGPCAGGGGGDGDDPADQGRTAGIVAGSLVAVAAGNGPRAPKVGGGAKLANITAGEATRIQNAANRIGREITLVGSRAEGTAGLASDWDYLVNASGKEQHRIINSLPGAELRAEGIRDPVEFLRGALDPSRPHITFYPR